MNTNHRHIPPIGVRLTQDIANRHGRFRARARWSDPTSHERRSYSATFDREGEARTFLEQLESRTHIASDPLISLADYIAEIGDRYLRGLDPSSTAADIAAASASVCFLAWGTWPYDRSALPSSIGRSTGGKLTARRRH